MPVLETAIADITNSPISSIKSAFVEMPPTSTSRNINFRKNGLASVRTTDSNGYRALINVTVIPTDIGHEIEILDTMNDTASFLSEMNSKLLGQWDEYNASVINVSDIERIPGKIFCFTFLWYSL